jgi:hypothetical protein
MDVATNSTQLAPYLIGSRSSLYYQRRNYIFYPQPIFNINSTIIQLKLLFSGGMPDTTFSILLSFTPDMNYQSFIEQVIREILSIGKWSRLIGCIMERLSHSSGDFQIFLIPINSPVRIQMILELLCDNCMERAFANGKMRW